MMFKLGDVRDALRKQIKRYENWLQNDDPKDPPAGQVDECPICNLAFKTRPTQQIDPCAFCIYGSDIPWSLDFWPYYCADQRSYPEKLMERLDYTEEESYTIRMNVLQYTLEHLPGDDSDMIHRDLIQEKLKEAEKLILTQE